jgi:hypothetical protein
MPTTPAAGTQRTAPRGRAHLTPAGRSLSDLRLGAQLALRGGGEVWVRSALTAAGVALAMIVLLLGAAVPHIVAAHYQRDQAQSVNWSTSPQHLLGMQVTTYYDGHEIGGLALQATQAGTPLPPGVDKLPTTGELAVSPALKQMIEEPGGRRLAQLLGGRVSGEIGGAGLTGPRQLIYYLGASDLALRPGAGPIAGFHGSPDVLTSAQNSIITVLEIVLAVGLLTPIGQFIVTASRFGSERRNERLAAIRLLGADRSASARIATGETLPGVFAGMALGALLFLALRPLIGHVELFGLSVFTGDVRPSAALVLLVVVLVPLICTLSTLMAMRRVVYDPLAATRRSVPSRRRLAWRLVILAVGFLLLTPLILHRSYLDDGSVAAELVVALGVILVLLGVAALTPWAVEAFVARAGSKGSPSWLLAVRSLRRAQATVGRVIATIALAVAGAVALQLVFASAGSYDENPATTALVGNQSVNISSIVVSGPGALARVSRRLATLPGAGQPRILGAAMAGSRVLAGVAPCSTLARIRALRPCRPDSIYLAADAQLSAGGRLHVGTDTIKLPAGVRRLQLGSALSSLQNRLGVGGVETCSTTEGCGRQSQFGLGGEEAKLLLTPAAAQRLGLHTLAVQLSLPFSVPPGNWMRLHDAVALIDPVARVENGISPVSSESSELHTLNNLLLAGALLVLVVLAAGVLVANADQLRERRAAIAGLAALGTPRRVLAGSLIWQTAIQLVLGTLIAIAIGLGLGAALVAVIHGPLRIDVAAIAALAGAAIALVVPVTLASLPLLARQMRPSALRTE